MPNLKNNENKENTNLARNGVGFTDLVTPITTSNWDDRQLSQNDGATNSSGNFLAALNAQSNVSIWITDGNESLESGSLTSTSLFLDRHDFQDFVTQWTTQEEIDDLELFDGQGVQVNFLQGTDLCFTNQTAQLGDWSPFFRVFLATSAPSTSSTTASPAPSSSTWNFNWYFEVMGSSIEFSAWNW